MAQPLKVLIIGAGVTGLSLAHGLKKSGIDFEIFEKYTIADRPRDWGINVHWAVEFLKLYPDDIEPRLREAQVDPHRERRGEEFVYFWNGQTAEELVKVPLGPAKRFSQKRLRQLLTEEIDVQYSKALESIRELPDGIEAVFTDGTTATGTLLVGADGSQSNTRRHLFKNPEDAIWKRSPGYLLNNFHFQLPREKALEVRKGLGYFLDVAIHPNGSYFGLVPLDVTDQENPENWHFQVFMAFRSDISPEEDTPARRYKLVKEAGKHFIKPFCQAIEWMPEDVYISPDIYGTWETTRWDHKGHRAILAGDAAHAMTAHRAQGLNHALQDVLNIRQGLEDVKAGKRDLAQVVESYLEDVVPRGAEEVRMSLKQGLAVHTWAQLDDSPIMTIGATPLHMESELVPKPTRPKAVVVEGNGN